MAIEHRDKDSGGYRIDMTACPLCGQAFAPRASRAWHFYSEHTWEDLGL